MQPSILFLVDALERPGGTETHLQELAKRLPAEGYTPIVCNLAGDQPILKVIAESGVETWPVTLHRLYAPAGRGMVRKVISRTAGRRVAAVHTFHFKSDWMGVGVARALECPLISSRRDLGFAQTPLRRLALRFIDPHVDAFIAPSRAVRAAVHKREGVAEDRIRIIYNGLDPSRYTVAVDSAEVRRELGIPLDATAITMVGNLRPVKDHTTLFKAMAPVAAAYPKAHLVLVGQGTEQERLSALAESLGIRNHITFAGSRKDVPRVLAATDIFVLSTHSEGMSNAIIEAMAAGLPVVATDVGGNAECIVDGETGYIVPHEGVDSLASRLCGLLEDPVAALKMGTAGRTRVEDVFDVQAMVRHTADLYRELSATWRPHDG